MPRPQTKVDLINAAAENYKKLVQLIDSMTELELSTQFDFSKDEKKKEAHWGRDKNLRDILIHLYEWHQLMIHCIASNESGHNKQFLPEEYSWKTYGAMNVMFWKKHQTTDLQSAREMLQKSHEELMKLMEKYSNDELFSKGVYAWTGSSTLGSYFISTTSSHYDWAMKKLKAHKKIILR